MRNMIRFNFNFFDEINRKLNQIENNNETIYQMLHINKWKTFANCLCVQKLFGAATRGYLIRSFVLVSVQAEVVDHRFSFIFDPIRSFWKFLKKLNLMFDISLSPFATMNLSNKFFSLFLNYNYNLMNLFYNFYPNG